ncbi:MAG: hypothetical protein ACETVY_03235 [Candidatus Bathyarchaeia archaeon]
MSITRQFIKKRTVLCLLLLVIAFYAAGIYLRYRSLYDDDLMIELIRNDERVEFEHVQLESVVMSTRFWGLFGVSSPGFGGGSTMYIRYFTAWKYSPDEVSEEDNYKKCGWVDMRHRVYMSDPLKGSWGFV